MDGPHRLHHEVDVRPRSEGGAAEGLRRGGDEDDQGALNSEGGFRPLPNAGGRYRIPSRLARSSTLFVSAVSSGTLPSGVIRSTTSGSSCERPRDASAWLMPARREISSIPSFPKICVIASGGIG